MACNGVGAVFLPDLLIVGNKHCIEEAAAEGGVSRMLTLGAFCEKADSASYKKNKTFSVMLRVVEHTHADGTRCIQMGMGKYKDEVLCLKPTQKRKRGQEHEQQDA